MVPSKMTEQVKLDLHVLRLRSAMDPTQHYKKIDTKGMPKTFQVTLLFLDSMAQVGTIVDDPTNFYSSRSTKRDRKKDIIDSILSDPTSRMYYNKKFQEIQAHKQRSARDIYRKRMQISLPAWKFKSSFKKFK